MKEYRQIPSDRAGVLRCEQAFFDRLAKVADQLCAVEGLRLCSLSGPTCSGKTTAAAMLTARLAGQGKNAHIISIDDFYYDTQYLHRLSREKGLEGIDYDSVATIDLEGLRRFTEEIFSSSEVHVPVFDFRHGARTGYRTVKIGKDDIFLFEGIQAAYSEVTALFEPHGWQSVYIAPLSAICVGNTRFEPNQIRLLRRLVRDFLFRQTSPSLTFSMWEGVRRNEEAHIFPYIDRFAHHIDSTMPYEIGVLRPYLERILGDIGAEEPCFGQANDILTAVRGAEPIPADWIADGSLYREFI